MEKELCGGNQTFVVAENTETQLVVGLVTQEAWQTAARTVVEEAVERHKFSSKEPFSSGNAVGGRGKLISCPK